MQVWILPMCCQKFNFKIAMFKIKTFLGTTWLVWAIIAHRLWLFSHSCECLDELFWRMVPRSTSEEPVEWPPADVDVFRMVLDCNVANGCRACLIDFIFCSVLKCIYAPEEELFIGLTKAQNFVLYICPKESDCILPEAEAAILFICLTVSESHNFWVFAVGLRQTYCIFSTSNIMLCVFFM